MKIAIISLTDNGFKLSNKIKNKLNKDSTVIKTDVYFKDVKKTFPLLFDEYDAIIAIMASGILIRSIAPLIQSKDCDPAILNIDDNGKFVVSALSGHIGGANSLTLKIAELIDATPVITTATDANKKLGIDVIARDLFLSISNKNEILFFNKAILEGREISLIINPNKNYDYLFNYLNKNTLEINVSIYYTSKIKIDEIHVKLDEHELILKEKKLVVGIGCKKDKQCNDIYKGLKKSLNDLNLTPSRVNFLASAEIKKNEKGLLDLSEKLDIPIKFVEMEKLKLFTSGDVSKSDFVKSKFGIYGVCEPSALIVAGFDSELIYKKTSFDGVTIAISVK